MPRSVNSAAHARQYARATLSATSTSRNRLRKRNQEPKTATLAKPAAENAPKESINTNSTSVDAKTETPKNDAVAEKPIELKKEA